MRPWLVLLAAGSLLASVSPTRAEAPAGAGGATAKGASTGETPRAETAPRRRSAAPPYRLIRVLPETHQALLYDRARGTHVLVDAGHTLGGFEVTEIGADHVVLARPGDAREYVLVAGEAPPVARTADPYPIPDPAPAAPGGRSSPLIDPYSGVLDPYGSDGVREVQAPPGQRASEEPPPADPAKAPNTAKAPPPKPAPPAGKPDKADRTAEQPGAPAPAPDGAPTELTVSRARLDAALSDFARIEREVTMNVVSAGVALQRVDKGSFFYEMGLRDGDIVRKVDGTLIRGMDDAATVYARFGKVSKFQVDVQRGGKPVTLRYTITK